MSAHPEPGWVDELLAQAGWLRRIAGELVAGDLADDVAQEVLVASLRNPPGNRDTPRAWLRTVMWNVVRSGFRSDCRRHQREALAGEGDGTADSPEDLVARVELQRCLAEQILGLDEPYRRTVILRYLEGRSAAEIARALGVPAGTVRRRLKVGLDRLRAGLDERCGGRRERWLRALVPLAPGDAALGAARPEAPAGPGSAPALRATTGLLLASALGAAGLLGWAGTRPEPPAHLPQAWGAQARLPPPAGSVFARDPAPPAPARARAEPGRGLLVGTVLDARGRPATGARLTLTSLADTLPVATSLSDGRGGFDFLGLVPGEYTLTAATGSAWAGHEPIVVRAREPTAVELRLQAGAGTLEGRIFDAHGGGVPRARVAAWRMPLRWGAKRVFESVADQEGRYRLALPAGRYALGVKASGYGPVDTWAEVAGRRTLDVRLHPAARLAGRVIERPSGRALPDVVVSVVDPFGRARAVNADSTGAFELDVAAGPHTVWARQGPLFGAVTVLETWPAEVRSFDLPLERAVPLRGRLRAPHGGRPQPGGLTITATLSGERPGCRGAAAKTTSSSDGSFTLDGVPACPVELTVDGPAAAPVSARLSPRSSSEARWIDIALAPEARLVGRVLGSRGAPASEARITARVHRLGDSSARVVVRALATDGDGRFELAGLPGGEVWLAIEARDGTDAGTALLVERLAAGEVRELTTKLAPPASISGRAVHPDGAAAAGIRLEAVTVRAGVSFGFNASAVSAPDGSFSLGPLAEGSVSLQAGSAWFGARPGVTPQVAGALPLDLGAGERRAGIIFTVPRAGRDLGGAVVDAEGRPAAGAAVDLYTEDGAGQQRDFQTRGFSDETGAILFSDLSEGRYQVRARHPTLGWARASRIAPGTGRVVLQLQPGPGSAGPTPLPSPAALP